MTAPLSALNGSCTPLVVPLREGAVDLDMYAGLVEFQVREGSHGIVVNGTTGEPTTLTIAERTALVSTAVEAAAGRIPVYAATGSQSLDDTLSLTRQAEDAGADALLVVTPYFIRPPQRGLVEYYARVGAASGLPMMIYHIPGRAGVSMDHTTVAQSAERTPTLIGMKHASLDLGYVTGLLQQMGPDFKVFVGLEEVSFPLLAIGACGLMNAVGNILPRRIADLYEAAVAGDMELGRRLHDELDELNRAVFWDTNPIPMKYLMKVMGLLADNEHRLPMMRAEPALERRLDDLAERMGLTGSLAGAD